MKRSLFSAILAGAFIVSAATAAEPILGIMGEVRSNEPPPFRETSRNGDHEITWDFRNKPVAPANLGGPEGGGSGVPYPLVPDWQNTQRRQVGALVIADMNGDGRNDLVVGCFNSSSFPPYDDWRNLIYYNTGSSLEANPSWVSNDQVSTGDILVGRVNNDAYPDIVSVNGGTGFAPSVVYYGSASGPDTASDWTATPPTATWATSGTLFDFDHDGDLDFFTTNQGLSPNPFRPAQGFRNNGTTLETSPFWQSAESSIQNGLEFGDLDGDGWEDLFMAKWVNFQTGIYKNTMGTLGTVPVWTSGDTTGDKKVGIADIDGDGDKDFIVGRGPTIMYTNTAGTLSQTYSNGATSNPEEIRMFDVDRDGDQDLTEVYFSNGVTRIFLNENGALHATHDWQYDSTQVGNTLAFGDINGDGWADLAIGYSGDNSVAVFYARIPVIPGDMNCDGQVNSLDVDAFVLAVLDSSAYTAAYPFCFLSRGDFTADTQVDGDDVQGFCGALIGP